MRQLSGLDAAFLAMESPEVFLHIGTVYVLDPSTAAGPLTLRRLTEHIASRQHLVPLLRRRLVGVPLGLDQPYWVEDSPPDLGHHIREVELPGGDDTALAQRIAQLHARPLDRSRPLWELYLISGLAGGRSAIYTKFHHAAMDGVSGDDVLSAMLDPTPEGRPVEPSAVATERPPATVSLLARSARSLLEQPVRATSLGTGLLQRLPWLAVAAADRLPVLDRIHHHDPLLPHLGLRAPHTPFNAPVSARRCWAFADLSLTDIKRLKCATRLTVNDIVMALCAGAMRRWLIAHDALPDQPLVAAVPVSVRAPGDADSCGNRLSVMFAAVPTNIGAPDERLAATGAALRAAKAEQAAIPPTLLTDVTGFALPWLANPGWQWSTRLRLLERVNPFNLFISNIPGPRIPLYYAGARLRAYHPVSAIAHGQGLNITALSYRDRISFGLLSCPELVPDVDRLAAWLGEELELLLAQRHLPTREEPAVGSVVGSAVGSFVGSFVKPRAPVAGPVPA
jgi:diacylglycerol O-acyltransferase